MIQSTKFVCFQDGCALFASDDPAFSTRFAIQVGSTKFLFEPRPIEASGLIEGANLLLNSRFTSGPENWSFIKAAAPGVTFGVDFLPEAQLNGMNTAYLTGPDKTDAFGLRYNDPTFAEQLPVSPGEKYEFTGYFATHRALGRVEITFCDARKKAISVASEVLTERVGGRNLQDYQQVTLRGTVPSEATFAQITIHFLTAHNAVPGMQFFIFFSDLSFTIGQRHGEAKAPMLDPAVARSLIEIAQRRSTATLFGACFDTDLVTRSQMSISLVPLRDNQDSEDHIVFYDPAIVKAGAFAQINFDNHRLLEIVLHGIEIGRIFCDGELAEDIELRPSGGGTFHAQLPYRLLDGQHHLIEMRDFEGLTRLAQDYFLFPNVLTPWTVLQEHSAPWPPSHLAPSAADRYRSLQSAIEAIAQRNEANPAGALQQLAHCHNVIVRGFEHNRAFNSLSFPVWNQPIVSVVIPVHNKFEITYFCLCALIVASNKATFEVIVVDDGSTDRTGELNELVSGITIVRNEVGQGFIDACNRGAQVARGEFVVLLNNDTEPTVGWLDELISVFTLFDQVGLAGSKLVYPDGRLQEAGGIIWSNGNPWNYGRGQNPNDPRYSYTRQADYLSGAAIMLPVKVWQEVGGFSTDFTPAYFEDTDLAFKVRAKGYKTLFAPKSVVYHFEGATGGTDVSSGAKSYQEVNRPKFKSKWFTAYRKHGKEGTTPDLEKDRGIYGRALFIDYQMPKPDMDAGSYAAVEEMRLVQGLGYQVTFVPQNLAYLGRYAEDLQRQGIEVLYAPFVQSIEQLLEQRGRDFDLIYVTRYYVVSSCHEAVRRWAPQAKFIMNNADLHFLRELRAGIADRNQALIDVATQTRDAELEMMRRVDMVLTYNDTEQAVILSHNLSSTRVMRAPWVERLTPEIAPLDQRRDIAFLGSYNHHPNREAVTFFAKKIMPVVRDVVPGTKFRIYGSYLPPVIRALKNDDVVIGGYVEDVAEVFGTCRVFVAPLTSGAGIKGKVLKALAHGVPCVLSPIAAEGTGVRHGFDCFIAETPAEWAQAIQQLCSDPVLWESMSKRGRELIQESYSYRNGLKVMRKTFEAVELFVP